MNKKAFPFSFVLVVLSLLKKKEKKLKGSSQGIRHCLSRLRIAYFPVFHAQSYQQTHCCPDISPKTPLLA